MKVIDLARSAEARKQSMQVEREIDRIPVAMRPGRRECNQASLQVGMSDAVPEHMRAGIREITALFVPHEFRRQKLATILLNFVCQEADANRITLILTATPEDDEGLNQEQLVAWYQRFGFQVLPRADDAPYLMARQVHEKPRIIRSGIPDAVRKALTGGSLN